MRTLTTSVGSVPTKFLHPFAKPAAEHFIEIVRGEGSVLYTSDGRALLDGMAALWYCQVGHGRREIADAVYAQMQVLETYSCFEPFTNGPAERIAARIADLSPLVDPRVFLTCSGSEAVDSVLKLARIAQAQAGHPERTLIISRNRGYHGVTYGGLSAQGLPPNKAGFGPMLPEVIQVPHDDLEAVATLMAERGHEVAAILTEPVQGAGGVHPPTDGYLRGLRRLCDQHGAYLIFDEVICGFGRLGTWFAAQHYGVTPDLMTFAKGVTSGYQPLGGVIVGRTVCDALESDPTFMLRHGFTYSGHAACAAAGLANIDIIESEGLLDRAKVLGARLSDGLRSIESDGLIAGVRGDGAVWAVQHHDDRDSFAVRDAMLERGVIVRALPGCNTFCPPLVTTEAQIDQMVDALADCLR